VSRSSTYGNVTSAHASAAPSANKIANPTASAADDLPFTIISSPPEGDVHSACFDGQWQTSDRFTEAKQLTAYKKYFCVQE
jgi:hypothetical protein